MAGRGLNPAGPTGSTPLRHGSQLGWPFWAGTSDERVDEALRLAELRPGEGLLDLGCGDGRVLLRAAEAYGAKVRGVELDPGLAATARERLAAAGADGTVLEADFETGKATVDLAAVLRLLEVLDVGLDADADPAPANRLGDSGGGPVDLDDHLDRYLRP